MSTGWYDLNLFFFEKKLVFSDRPNLVLNIVMVLDCRVGGHDFEFQLKIYEFIRL